MESKDWLRLVITIHYSVQAFPDRFSIGEHEYDWVKVADVIVEISLMGCILLLLNVSQKKQCNVMNSSMPCTISPEFAKEFLRRTESDPFFHSLRRP
jgi:hypothetical protein